MALNVLKCSMCGGIYAPCGLPFCQDCMQRIDEGFVKIRDYVYDNPNAKVAEILEETGVEEKVVSFLIKQGRLKTISVQFSGACERCGRPAAERFCPECAAKLHNAFGGEASRIAREREEARKEQQRKALESQKGAMYTKR